MNKKILISILVCGVIAISTLFPPAVRAAYDEDLTLNEHTGGLQLESPLAIVGGAYDAHLLSSITYEHNDPLPIDFSESHDMYGPVLPTPTPTGIKPYASPSAALRHIDGTTQITHVDPPTPTPSPTIVIRRALPTPTPDSTSTPTTTTETQVSNPGGLNPEVIFSMVNTHRTQMGLNALEKDPRSCQLAQSRAGEIGAEIAGGYMHQGLKNRNLPYWNTENIISMATEAGAFDWWIHDQIHKEAIEGAYKYTCVACSGNSCAQEFTNFQAK